MNALEKKQKAETASLEADLTIAVVSMMGRLRLKEIALYAGEHQHVGTFRFRENRIWFYPAPALHPRRRYKTTRVEADGKFSLAPIHQDFILALPE